MVPGPERLVPGGFAGSGGWGGLMFGSESTGQPSRPRWVCWKWSLYFQAVAEDSVHADVREPYQSERQDERFVLPPSEGDHRRREGGAVCQVVGDSAEAGATEIADHDHVGDQEDERYQPPGLVGGRIGDERTSEKCDRLEA